MANNPKKVKRPLPKSRFPAIQEALNISDGGSGRQAAREFRPQRCRAGKRIFPHRRRPTTRSAFDTPAKRGPADLRTHRGARPDQPRRQQTTAKTIGQILQAIQKGRAHRKRLLRFAHDLCRGLACRRRTADRQLSSPRYKAQIGQGTGGHAGTWRAWRHCFVAPGAAAIFPGEAFFWRGQELRIDPRSRWRPGSRLRFFGRPEGARQAISMVTVGQADPGARVAGHGRRRRTRHCTRPANSKTLVANEVAAA